MATLGQEVKNLRSELQEHRFNAVEGNPRTVDPNQKGRQNATRFSNYCRTNGQTPSWCRKKIRDEELNRIENERTAEKKSRLLSLTTKNADHTIDQNNGLEARFSKEETRTLLTIDLGEIPLLQTKNSLQDQTWHMGKTIRTMEDHMTNAKISHLIETIEIDLEMHLSTIRMETGETLELFLVLHRLKGETSHKIFPTVNQEGIKLTTLPSADLIINPRLVLRLTNKNSRTKIKLTTLPSADLTINPRLVLRLTNKNSRKTIIRLHLIKFASPQSTEPLRNYQTSVR